MSYGNIYSFGNAEKMLSNTHSHIFSVLTAGDAFGIQGVICVSDSGHVLF